MPFTTCLAKRTITVVFNKHAHITVLSAQYNILSSHEIIVNLIVIHPSSNRSSVRFTSKTLELLLDLVLLLLIIIIIIHSW